MNIGIPSETYGDIKLRERFELAARVAWYVSVQEKIVDIDLIKEAFIKIDEVNLRVSAGDYSVLDEACRHPSYFATHPEVIMEVVGYVKSPLGEQGMHLLIDVGASTLDVASFRVGARDGEHFYPILKSKVGAFGSLMLHRERVDRVRLKIQTTLNAVYDVDPIKPLPPIKKYQVGLYEEDLQGIDTEFQTLCYKTIGDVVAYTKKNGDPFSSAWRSYLPVFVCGGGSKDKFYTDVVDSMSKKLSNALSEFNGFKILNIPKPETLHAPHILSTEYNRLAVAYGLSFSIDEIGEVIPESKVDTIKITKPDFDPTDRFIGAEMM